MMNRMVISLKGKNLQITIPDNSPLQDHERILVAGSEAGRKRSSCRQMLLFEGERDQTPVALYLSGYYLKEFKNLLQHIYLVIAKKKVTII